MNQALQQSLQAFQSVLCSWEDHIPRSDVVTPQEMTLYPPKAKTRASVSLYVKVITVREKCKDMVVTYFPVFEDLRWFSRESSLQLQNGHADFTEINFEI